MVRAVEQLKKLGARKFALRAHKLHPFPALKRGEKRKKHKRAADFEKNTNDAKKLTPKKRLPNNHRNETKKRNKSKRTRQNLRVSLCKTTQTRTIPVPR